jgi:hypothetical protein
MRAPVIGDEHHAVARQLARQRHRLIRIADVVAYDQLDSLAEKAALGVEILDRQLGAALIALAGPGLDAGHRASNANPDLGLRRRSPKRRNRDDADDEQSRADHTRAPK